MLINLSNHPKTKWDQNQITEAERAYGEIIDLQFPLIQPEATLEEVQETAKKYFEKIKELLKDVKGENAVHLMGEFTFTFNLAFLLKESGIETVASVTERKVEFVNGAKVSIFNFKGFRKYF
jgi:hypothetical protein